MNLKRDWDKNPGNGHDNDNSEPMPKWMLWFLALAFIFVIFSCGLDKFTMEDVAPSMQWSTPESLLDKQ